MLPAMSLQMPRMDNQTPSLKMAFCFFSSHSMVLMIGKVLFKLVLTFWSCKGSVHPSMGLRSTCQNRHQSHFQATVLHSWPSLTKRPTQTDRSKLKQRSCRAGGGVKGRRDDRTLDSSKRSCCENSLARIPILSSIPVTWDSSFCVGEHLLLSPVAGNKRAELVWPPQV